MPDNNLKAQEVEVDFEVHFEVDFVVDNAPRPVSAVVATSGSPFCSISSDDGEQLPDTDGLSGSFMTTRIAARRSRLFATFDPKFNQYKPQSLTPAEAE
jgi:hypothetical protein